MWFNLLLAIMNSFKAEQEEKQLPSFKLLFELDDHICALGHFLSKPFPLPL